MSDPERIIADAAAAVGTVIRRVCLTSGGGDSTVLAHRCRDAYDELVHIDTGTALPGVRTFVEDFAANVIGKPLRVVEAGDAYRRLVLGEDAWWPLYHEHRLDDEAPEDFRDRMAKLPTRTERMAMGVHIAPIGFPGPAMHAKAYQRLKERQLEAALRSIRAEHGSRRREQRVLLLSGVRLAESQRRKMTGTARGEWERRGNQVWINPLLDWTNLEMRRYRRDHGLPISDATALTHRSGECNCLAFAAKGEREFLISMYPGWYATTIEPLEVEAKARGLRRWRWGWGGGDADLSAAAGAVGPMCNGCEQLTLELMTA